MEARTTEVPAAGQLLVSISDLSMMNDIKKAISMLKGVTTVKKQKAASKREQSQARLSAAEREQARPKGKTKPRLYDPETGEYLNDETMKVIEDVRSGKEPLMSYSSFEDFKKAMREL